MIIVEEKALIHGDWPFGYLLPAGAGKAQQELTVNFVADDQQITEQDVTGPLRTVDSELAAA